MSFDQMMTLGSLLVALTALITNTISRIRSDSERDGTISVKMDFNTKLLQETRDSVRSIDDKMCSMESRVTTLETKVAGIDKTVECHSNRIIAIEKEASWSEADKS